VGAGVSLALAARSATACTTATGAVCKVSCFLHGTKIKATKGQICIEELRIGDRVLTVLGEAKQVKFVGRRDVWRERSQPWNDQGPVKISRFAIDGKVSHSDLYTFVGDISMIFHWPKSRIHREWAMNAS
jgi:hypothetical protein